MHMYLTVCRVVRKNANTDLIHIQRADDVNIKC